MTKPNKLMEKKVDKQGKAIQTTKCTKYDRNAAYSTEYGIIRSQHVHFVTTVPLTR